MLTYTSDNSHAKNNYLDCAEIQQYLPSSIAADYCGTQNKCSSQSPCNDVPVCKTENGVCRIQCGADHYRDGEYCHYAYQHALNIIAQQIEANRGEPCTVPIITPAQTTSSADCGTFIIETDDNFDVTSLFVLSNIMHIHTYIVADILRHLPNLSIAPPNRDRPHHDTDTSVPFSETLK